ncbi:hypothetical protein [Winogradskyella thalassocola]|uniref:Uncharacterized protein n=1 Tax=Winogradskyella thalassocola TaxID=262004 RepID=A0A1G7VS43_9FLAO|nr:hypothetical protein [Winogradskyella thalassocola]SDG62517.1 hypothetical protein SAMN04489796_101116 [Winogradskyella thalassocola]
MKRLLSNSVILIMILLSCYSCKNNTTKHQAIQLEGLTLNNNQKWIANEETHIGMKRIDSILKNNTSSSGKILGDVLSKQTSYIIKSCDMEGEPHDQLHVVLVPILEEITDIKDVENTSELEKKVTNLQRLTATYFEYFKIN